MAFRPDCDTAGAQEIAERILLGLSSQKMGLAGVELAVTIGIAAYAGPNADFSGMYRDAQAALYQARVDGKSNIGLFETGAAPKQNRKIKLGTAAIT
jgi:GGDEF domain-containing protein